MSKRTYKAPTTSIVVSLARWVAIIVLFGLVMTFMSMVTPGLYKFNQVMVVVLTTPTTDPTSSTTVAVTNTEVPATATSSATPAETPTTPTRAPVEPMVTLAATASLPPLTSWRPILYGDSAIATYFEVGGVCYKFPAHWEANSAFKKRIVCDDVAATALNLAEFKTLPEGLAVAPVGSITDSNYVYSVAAGKPVERETHPGYTRVCSLYKRVVGVTYYRIVVGMNESFTGNEDGECTSVVEYFKGENTDGESHNQHLTVLHYIGQLYKTIGQGTYKYSVQLPERYQGNWLGKLPMERD